MSELPLTYRGAVYPWHCDHVGHMNVMYYTGKFDEATWNFFALLGVTPKFLRENGRGMAAVEQKTRYLSELHAGDIVTIRSRLLLLEGKKIRSMARPTKWRRPANCLVYIWIRKFVNPARFLMMSRPMAAK